MNPQKQQNNTQKKWRIHLKTGETLSGVHMQEKTIEEDKVLTNLKNIKHILVVLSGKGGVGKSTVAVNLALFLSKKGYNVGLLDGDLHGPSIPKILGIEDQKPGISQNGIIPVIALSKIKVMSMGFLLQNNDLPVIWRGPLKMGAIKQFLGEVIWGNLDYLIIDLPPGTGDEPLSIAQLIPKNDGAVIVTTPQDVALVSVRKSINFVKKMNMPIIGIVENMSGFSCPHCGKNINIFKMDGGKKASDDFSIPFLGKIPIDPEIVKSGDSGASYLLTHPKEQAAQAFAGIVEKIEQNIKKNKCQKTVNKLNEEAKKW